MGEEIKFTGLQKYTLKRREQTNTQTDRQTDTQTHQYHVSPWPMGRAEFKKSGKIRPFFGPKNQKKSFGQRPKPFAGGISWPALCMWQVKYSSTTLKLTSYKRIYLNIEVPYLWTIQTTVVRVWIPYVRPAHHGPAAIWLLFTLSCHPLPRLWTQRAQKDQEENTNIYVFKLNGVGPVDNRPSTNLSTHKIYMWHMISDTWHMTHDTWHLTPDRW